jgi:pyrroline-5-carboxylate reductase
MTSVLDSHRIGFIGCGAMARALCGGLLAADIPAEHLRGADVDGDQRKTFEEELGVETMADNAALVAASDIVVLCVKPGVVYGVLSRVANPATRGEKLWISIAAGVRLPTLEAALGPGSRVVRVMPNTPALVGEGASVLCPNAAATPADRAAAEALFDAVGTTWEAPSEGLLDAVTGLSGSGPAYVFLILEALGDAGVRQGLPREAAHRLACQTVLGAARLAIESGRHPAALKDQVTSPGGTTIAGIEQLEQAGVRAALYRAVEAATRRSRELAD